jgi:Protein-tyrosine-phosphatase
MGEEVTRIAFICVENAGRSQMAAAFAEEKVRADGAAIEVLSGGTAPAESVHPEVIGVMREVGVDLTRRRPQEISEEKAETADIIIRWAVRRSGCVRRRGVGTVATGTFPIRRGGRSNRSGQSGTGLERGYTSCF